MSKKKRITRDNFDAKEILSIYRSGTIFSMTEANRLLEEACHAYIRKENKLNKLKFLLHTVLET